MHDLDRLNRDRRQTETDKLDAARAMLAALEAAHTYLKPACEDGRYNARLLDDKLIAAIAAAKAAGIKAED